MGDEFGEYLALAAADVLRQRDLFVFGMRYGLLDGDAHTLE